MELLTERMPQLRTEVQQGHAVSYRTCLLSHVYTNGLVLASEIMKRFSYKSLSSNCQLHLLQLMYASGVKYMEPLATTILPRAPKMLTHLLMKRRDLSPVALV